MNVNFEEDKKRSVSAVLVRNIICVLLSILAILPFYLLLVNATRSSSDIVGGINFLPGGEFFTNIGKVFKGYEGAVTLQKSLLNSIIITVPATILQVYFGSLTAYAVTVYQFKLRNFAWAFIYGIMMIPQQLSIVGLIRVCQLTHLYGTRVPLIIPAIAAPTTVYFMKQYMESGLSLEMIEAARIDGAGEFKIFNNIALPILMPAMATQAIFAFVASWNNLYTPSLLLATVSKDKGTMPMFVEALKSDDKHRDYGQIYAGLFLTVLPILIAYLCLSKYIVEGVALGGVKE